MTAITTYTGRTGSHILDAGRAAQIILHHFDDYSRQFHRLTTVARMRFERREWREARRDALLRMSLYERTLTGLHKKLKALLQNDLRDHHFWTVVKPELAELVAPRCDIDLAETFFNSTVRKVLETVGLDRDVEFFRLESRPTSTAGDEYVYHRFPMGDQGTADVIRLILESYRFNTNFENLERDAQRAADELDLYVWPVVGEGSLDCIDMIRAPFFRNRVAYLVGRLVSDKTFIPFIMPLYHGPRGIYVDAALFRERQASIIFGFAHSAFSVEIRYHRELIAFLKSILPQKPIAELYISIGYNKHGKTEFYRFLHHFIHESHGRFKIAPGQEGAVMIGFTLRNFRFVFKVVKDRPCLLRSSRRTRKTITPQEVMERYRNVRRQDHVGRLVDTQEFENLRFKKKRFTASLLREFRIAAKEHVTIEEEYVTIHHCYLQRRVVPLPMYITSESDPEVVRSIILDFGYFLKDLASVGMFPADLFNIWNCGVTSRRRVVLFDHDDVTSLRHIRFLIKPQAHSDWEELLGEEDRITAGPNDFFMDEIEKFLGVPHPLMGIFREVHGDLFSLRFWRSMQNRVKRGEVVNIIPYDRGRRFEGRYLVHAAGR